MTLEFLYNFIHQRRLAVVATISPEGNPQSAVVGVAVTEKLEIIFDTVKSSRKYPNLLQNPRIAVTIGWEGAETVQLEGMAVELSGVEDDLLREIYYAAYPDGRDRAADWEGLVHFKVVPKWVRYSNFEEPKVIEEMGFE